MNECPCLKCIVRPTCGIFSIPEWEFVEREEWFKVTEDDLDRIQDDSCYSIISMGEDRFLRAYINCPYIQEWDLKELERIDNIDMDEL